MEYVGQLLISYYDPNTIYVGSFKSIHPLLMG